MLDRIERSSGLKTEPNRGEMPERSEKPILTVYVVDDEKIVSQTLAAILNAEGYHAIAFTNPIDALQSAETVPPSLLISDVSMPEMNGIDLGIHFRSIHPSCRVLLVSGHSATEDLLATANLQGHDFEILAKPFHPNELLASIRNGAIF